MIIDHRSLKNLRLIKNDLLSSIGDCLDLTLSFRRLEIIRNLHFSFFKLTHQNEREVSTAEGQNLAKVRLCCNSILMQNLFTVPVPVFWWSCSGFGVFKKCQFELQSWLPLWSEFGPLHYCDRGAPPLRIVQVWKIISQHKTIVQTWNFLCVTPTLVRIIGNFFKFFSLLKIGRKSIKT